LPATRDTGLSDLHGRYDALLEQIGGEVNLAIGDGDEMGGNVDREILGLGFDNGQGRERATAVFVPQVRRTLEQAGINIENIARIGLSPRRTLQQQ
jgi:hypothetical protein